MKTYEYQPNIPDSDPNHAPNRLTAPAAPADAFAGVLLGLGESAESVRSFLREGSSGNTQASYRAAIRYWRAWHHLRYGQALTLPLPTAAVLQFIADHAQHLTDSGALAHDLPQNIDQALLDAKVKRKPGPFTPATVRHRLAILSAAHEIRALPNPCRTREVQTVVARMRAAYARRGERPARKDALTREPFEQLLATCDDSLIGLRDRALLLFGWASGGRRRSEIVHATLENTVRTPEGFLFHLTYSKTNQIGQVTPDMHKPLIGRAAQALDAWLTAADIREGALFRRVRRGGVVGGRLTPESILRMVQSRAALAGLSGNYTAHSLRSGFVTEAGRQGIPLPEVMAMTGHTSVATVMTYHRAGAAGLTRASRILETPSEAK
ncbi:site-specific integrase [Achromobacter aegrifaciens]